MMLVNYMHLIGLLKIRWLKNPHELDDPIKSAEVLRPVDEIEICRKNRLPKPIANFILNIKVPLKWIFFQKAKEKNLG